MDIENIGFAEVQDLIWALRYAQPSVDAGHERPATIEDLQREPSWTDDYRKFWRISQAHNATYGAER